MINIEKPSIEIINEKLKKYPPDVRELAESAIQLSSKYPEGSIPEQLLAIIRKLSKKQDGNNQ